MLRRLKSRVLGRPRVIIENRANASPASTVSILSADLCRNLRRGPHVNELPPEVLARILHAATASLRPSFVPAISFRSDPYTLPTLMRVCKHWSGVAHDFPDLWAIIDDLEREGVVTYLARSKSSLLIVYIHADIEWTVQQIMPHMHRVQELHIEPSLHMYHKAESLTTCLNQPAPVLQSFTLLGRWSAELDGPTDPSLFGYYLFGAQHPRLREVACSSWINTLGRLTHFSFTFHNTVASSTFVQLPSFTELLGFLLENSALEVLVFTDGMHLPGEFYPTHSKVSFPHLKSLGFGLMCPAFVARVLAYLIIPEGASLNVWDIWWEWHDDDTTHLGSIFPDDLSGMLNLASVSTLRCTQVEDDYLQLTAHGGAGQVIDIRGPRVARSDNSWDPLLASYGRTLMDLWRIFPVAHVTELWVGNTETTEPSHSTPLWTALFSALSALRKLVVVHSDTKRIIASLSAPSIDTLLCPQLDSVTLAHVRDPRDTLRPSIREFVAVRAEAGLPLSELHIIMRYMRPVVSSWTEFFGSTVVRTVAADLPKIRTHSTYLSVEQEKALTG